MRQLLVICLSGIILTLLVLMNLDIKRDEEDLVIAYEMGYSSALDTICRILDKQVEGADTTVSIILVPNKIRVQDYKQSFYYTLPPTTYSYSIVNRRVKVK